MVVRSGPIPGPRVTREKAAMLLNFPASRVALKAGEVLSLDDAKGIHIRPCGAQVWVTEEGDSSDFVVKPGEDFIVTRAGRTLVQALEPTWVDLEEKLAA